ncbi:MAG TPA: glycogen synthase [Trueperaceae bacterium]|nr:glycogen synthase [Trueperaceae bacterium]
MRILFASAEVAPFSKTGGLGDVAGALPEALASLGHEVVVVTPWYEGLRGDREPYWIGDVEVPFAGGFSKAGVGTLESGKVRYLFVGHDFFRRPELYGYADDVERFALFSRAVPQAAARVGFRPQLLHANDWHTGYLPMLLTTGWHLPDAYPGLPSLFTVHNVQYQGSSDLEQTLWWLRLPNALSGSYLHHFGRANALQAGVGFARRVTTVSPTYAVELTTPEFGFGLDGTFRSLESKLSGILNGIDTRSWDPATDAALPATYSRGSLAGKAQCGFALKQRFGLAADRPVIGVVSRLAEQKGIDLLLTAAPRLFDQGWALALLGTGDAATEALAQALATDFPSLAGVEIGFDDALARLIYAGADALAVPSRFEPCGLSQMIAMRYGTLPIVRATGGLADTVDDGRTGFVFQDATAAGVALAGAEAMKTGPGSPTWRGMQYDAMGQDFSWRRSAERYEALYRDMLPSAT